MNDKTIINTISKIHFVLISIFTFIFLTLFIVFIVLQNGIYINDISYPNIKAKQLYIKWNEKLSVVIKELDLKNSTNNKKSKIKLQDIDTILKEIVLFDTMFEKVLIENIHYNDISGSFKYLDGEDGYLKLSSPYLELKTSLFFQSHHFNIKIDSFIDKNKDISINGNIIINTNNKVELLTALNVHMLKDINFNVYSLANLDQVTYKIVFLNNIQDIKPIIDKYASTWEAKWWVRDAIDMSSLAINNFTGYVQYKHMEEAYKNLHVDAIVNDLKYTYNEKLDVIDTSYTELEFKEGVLHIHPKNAYTYKMFLDKSWLKIDFSKEHVFVNLHLLFNSILNKDLLYLLSVYNINLPFEQTQGQLKTDLKIDINLNTIDVEAHGNFYTNDAWINYLGLDLNVFDTNVILHNTNVSVKNMFVKYEDMATSHLDILFDAKKDIGKLDFRLDSVSFKDIGLDLKKTPKPLHVEYSINPKQDYINIDKSKWIIDNKDIDVQAMKIPFDMDTISAKIPKAKVKSIETLSAICSGKLFFKPLRADVDIDLSYLHYLTTTLDQKKLNIKFKYDDNNISITSSENIKLKTAKDIYVIDNLNININKKHIYIEDMNLSNENLFTSNISLDYNLNNKKGFMYLNELDVRNDTFKKIFKLKTLTKLDIENKDKNIIINSKDYNITYILNNYEWKVKVNSIVNIAKQSTLLKKYFINNGKFTLGKKYNENHIDFLLRSDYKYNFLVIDNKLVDNYVVSGKIDTKRDDIDIDINNVFHIDIKDNIYMKTQDIGLNLPKITQFLSDLDTDDDKNSMEVYFKAKNAFVYMSDKRHAISDTIEFEYKDKKLDAILKHQKGIATFKYINDFFVLKGKYFNDKFMNNLFALSEIKDGTMGFSIAGKAKKYKGVMYIKDSTIIDYKILNNVLAFVNTVPALLTFSLPGYNNHGLDIKRLYFDFEFENDIYNISNFSIDSKEINILGKGKASIKHNTIDMDLNLKTDLGSSVSKIPVVGYILLGEDSVSTSLTLEGKLDNPTVNTQVSHDIIVAPWNILKRTFTYPMKLFESEEKKK